MLCLDAHYGASKPKSRPSKVGLRRLGVTTCSIPYAMSPTDPLVTMCAKAVAKCDLKKAAILNNVTACHCTIPNMPGNCSTTASPLRRPHRYNGLTATTASPLQRLHRYDGFTATTSVFPELRNLSPGDRPRFGCRRLSGI